MSKRQRHDRLDRRRTEADRSPSIMEAPLPRRAASSTPLNPKTAAQADYIASIKRNQVTFGIGPAGVGKTYLAARIAGEMLAMKHVRKIVLTRPAVESGRSIGYLPGELEEKMAPYIASYGPGFRDAMGQGTFEYHLAKKSIEIVPLNFMQGLSWDEPTIALFDEAENATPEEMKMFLTRIGEQARVVIDGDPEQTMIRGKSGLIDGAKRLRYLKKVGIVEFTRDDIVRSGLVREILDAYDDPDKAEDQFELPGFLRERFAQPD
jgi:phosphate starvation-inducible protein PhoH and related proteins